LGKDAFLQLLVTQLENQDPLEPMEDTEFISQLAQFSNLEQMTNIAQGVDTLVESSSQDMLSGVNYIGKGVVSAGSTISKAGDESSTLYYTIDESAVKMTINVFDAAEQPDGTYSVTFAAEDINGQPVLTSTEVAGVVTSVESVDGNTLLNLSDGRSVNILDVREVAMVSQGTSQDAQDESGS
jgi:flagellar basal-body rod modification protein FlgD